MIVEKFKLFRFLFFPFVRVATTHAGTCSLPADS